MTDIFVVVAFVVSGVSTAMFSVLASQIWTRTGAYAKQSNSCYRSCRNQNWPSQLCRRHCGGRP